MVVEAGEAAKAAVVTSLVVHLLAEVAEHYPLHDFQYRKIKHLLRHLFEERHMNHNHHHPIVIELLF